MRWSNLKPRTLYKAMATHPKRPLSFIHHQQLHPSSLHPSLP